MSLTSYRAAPPRGKTCGQGVRGFHPRPGCPNAYGSSRICSSLSAIYEEEAIWSLRTDLDLCRPGGDLLSRVLRQSTIGAEAFDGRVRDGIGSYRLAEGHQAGEDQEPSEPEGQARTLDANIEDAARPPGAGG